MNIAWDDLQLFLAVAEERSLSGAARRLRLGQPTLSRRMALLEEALGERLFVRRPQGVELTAAGERLLPGTKRMAEWATEAERSMAGREVTPEGRVRVAAPPGVAFDFLPAVALTLRRTAPGVHLDVLAAVEHLNLARGEADLALRTRAPNEHDLVSVGRAEMGVGAYAAPSYARRLPKKYGITDVAWIAWAPPYDQLPPNPQLAAFIPGFRPAFASDDYVVQMAAAAAGLGAMVLGTGLHRGSRIAELTHLSQIDLGPLARGNAIHLVVAKRMVDVPRIRAVTDAILATIDPRLRPPADPPGALRANRARGSTRTETSAPARTR